MNNKVTGDTEYRRFANKFYVLVWWWWGGGAVVNVIVR